jgi:hypothetical protein
MNPICRAIALIYRVFSGSWNRQKPVGIHSAREFALIQPAGLAIPLLGSQGGRGWFQRASLLLQL